MFTYFSKAKKREVTSEAILVLLRIAEMNPPAELKSEVIKKMTDLVKEL